MLSSPESGRMCAPTHSSIFLASLAEYMPQGFLFLARLRLSFVDKNCGFEFMTKFATVSLPDRVPP